MYFPSSSSDSPMVDDSLHHLLLDDSYPYSFGDHQTDLSHMTTQDSLSNSQVNLSLSLTVFLRLETMPLIIISDII